MSTEYVKKLATLFFENADSERAERSSAYLRNQFQFIGLDTPLRRKLQKKHFEEYGKPNRSDLQNIVRELWSRNEREFLHTAIDILQFSKKLFETEDIELFEEILIQKSWWDTVDGMSVYAFGEYFKKFPNQTSRTKGYIESRNFWLQRVAILFQLHYKKETNTELLKEYIEKLSNSNEFFIQKAIGWILRQYARSDEQWVRDFVASHNLKPLSRREAMKHLQLD